MAGKRREEEAFVFHFMDILSAPILTHDSAWADSIPKRLIDAIKLQRLVAAIKHEEMATLPEVAAFMITRAFNAPMNHDWAEIYIHVGCKVCEQCFGEDTWDKVRGLKKLNDYQEGMLKHLRRWIYERRRMHVKKRMKIAEQTGSVVGTITDKFNFNDTKEANR